MLYYSVIDEILSWIERELRGIPMWQLESHVFLPPPPPFPNRQANTKNNILNIHIRSLRCLVSDSRICRRASNLFYPSSHILLRQIKHVSYWFLKPDSLPPLPHSTISMEGSDPYFIFLGKLVFLLTFFFRLFGLRDLLRAAVRIILLTSPTTLKDEKCIKIYIFCKLI